MTSSSHNRQARRTRTALKRAFVALLKESPYEAITVGDVAERANIGRSTFYRHYASKADLLLNWHGDISMVGHGTPTLYRRADGGIHTSHDPKRDY
jgi:hypothetical protein